jgi:hypothetical protein
MGSDSDRRLARRFTMTLPVRVMPHAANTAEFLTHTRDVSYRGLFFTANTPLQNGSEIDFVLTLPQKTERSNEVEIRCHGKVVRVEQVATGQQGIAAQIDRYEFVPTAV